MCLSRRSLASFSTGILTAKSYVPTQRNTPRGVPATGKTVTVLRFLGLLSMEPESEAGQTTFVSYDHVVELPAARGAQMSDYRVYFIGDDGHFASAIQLDCPNDIAAIESAKQFINGHDIELWQQDRIIAKFERKPGGQ